MLQPLTNAKANSEDMCISQNLIKGILGNDDLLSEQISVEVDLDTFVEPDYENIEESPVDILEVSQINFKEQISNDGLIYIAGYVAHRFRDQYPDLGEPTKNRFPENNPEIDWLQTISRGNLLYPKDELIKLTLFMEDIFNKFHRDGLSDEKFIYTKLTDQAITQFPNCSIPYEVVLCLARTRTNIRLRHLNRKISVNNCKRKLNKKISKFTNNKK